MDKQNSKINKEKHITSDKHNRQNTANHKDMENTAGKQNRTKTTDSHFSGDTPEITDCLIAVIGAGPAGMMAALAAQEQFENELCDKKDDNRIDYCKKFDNSNRIVIFEANSEAGKKLTVTGNGKCNFTNLNQSIEYYNSDNTSMVEDTLKRFNEKDCIAFFEKLGIPHTERNGYCYPYSEQAKSVRDFFCRELCRKNIPVIYDTRIKHIRQNADCDGFILVTASKKEIRARKVIVCCGGISYQMYGSNGDAFYMAGELGIGVEKPLQALCALKTDFKYISELDGVRAHASIFLHVDEDDEYTETGEIIFSGNGVSGIPVMNVSRHAVKALETDLSRQAVSAFGKDVNRDTVRTLETDVIRDKVRTFEADVNRKPVNAESITLFIDFADRIEFEKLEQFIYTRLREDDRPESLNGLINDKLSRVVYKIINDTQISEVISPCSEASYRIKSNAIALLLKSFRLNITGAAGFDKAQVTQGGIMLQELNEKLEVNKYPGLYFAGENVNVDAICGGYNLQWAFSSGNVAGKNSAMEVINN